MKKINYHKFKKELQSLKKTYFTIQDLKKFYKNKKSSLKNLLSRWSKEEIIFPLNNAYYCFDLEKLDYLNHACCLVKPSYISFEYALNYYGLIEQVPQVITLATTNKHKFIYSGPYTYEYTKIKKELFFGYERIKGYYIALPEKALLDTVYLLSRNKRLVDLSSLDFKKINKERLNKYAKNFPAYLQKTLQSF
ncbi:MAG: hypothetical protein HYY52_02385 [Candidatus Melainabacteria bacterium]|nr:hypothetical protein [Candidatus Melainabacteria bacterium]